VGSRPQNCPRSNERVLEDQRSGLDGDETADTPLTTERCLDELARSNPEALVGFRSKVETHADQLSEYPELQAFYDGALSDLAH
jgi:hypothetical protein